MLDKYPAKYVRVGDKVSPYLINKELFKSSGGIGREVTFTEYDPLDGMYLEVESVEVFWEQGYELVRLEMIDSDGKTIVFRVLPLMEIDIFN